MGGDVIGVLSEFWIPRILLLDSMHAGCPQSLLLVFSVRFFYVRIRTQAALSLDTVCIFSPSRSYCLYASGPDVQTDVLAFFHNLTHVLLCRHICRSVDTVSQRNFGTHFILKKFYILDKNDPIICLFPQCVSIKYF